MAWLSFNITNKTFLGIDIGTSAVKVVELSKSGKRIALENYGEIKAPAFFEKPFRTFEKTTLLLSTKDIARAIRGIIEEAKINTRKACFSIPDFSSFFTWFALPPMTKEEIPEAVRFEARQHIPLPLSEITLDWQIIEGNVSGKERSKTKVLLVAIPNDTINQYYKIAEMAQLKLQSLEAEVFSFSRPLINDNKATVAVLDIGARSTTCSIIDKMILKRSHSFDVAGNEFTSLVSKSLNIDYNKAEEVKKKYGIAPSEKKIEKILLPMIDLVLAETKKVFQNFFAAESIEVQKVIIGGGSALLPGLREYFAKSLNKDVEIANPFSEIFYPPILEKTLKEMGPAYAIAVGVAMQELRKIK